MIKRILALMAGAFSFCMLLNAQTITIVDKTTLRPLDGVSLSSEQPKTSTVTNAKGVADIMRFSGSSAITITHLGHRPVVVSYTDLQASGGTLHLSEQTVTLEEFVSSASRFEEKKRDVPEHIDIIKRRDITFLDQQTTPDLLQNSGTVFVQRSQMGGGSPVIRGFEASRVLLVVDGVRMNNAIYRAGHLQDLMTVDQNALDRIEVISGPGSVVYGSDALGGVIHMMTRKSLFNDTSGVAVGGGAYFRTSTANNEKTASATVELRGRKLTSLTSITASDFGNLRQGSTRNPFHGDWGLKPFVVEMENGTDAVKPNDDSNVQDPTAYKQLDVLEKLRLRTGENTIHQLNFQISTTNEVPRYDRLSEYSLDTAGNIVPVQAEWYYGPQKRMLAAYTLELHRETGIFTTARITPSYQAIEQSRHSRGFGSSRIGHNVEKVTVLGFNADFEKRSGKHEIRYGLEYYANDVTSEAERENINTGEITYRTTRYPNGGSTMNTIAAYASHTVEINEKLVISEGLRFSKVDLGSTFNDEEDFQFLNGTYTQSNSAFNWRLGLIYMPGRDWRFNVMGSTGFRAPNVDDIGKVFDSTPGTVIVPNTDLKPETTTNFEAGMSKTIDDRFTIEGTGFYTLYNNALTVGDHTVNGQDSIEYDGTMSKVTALTNKKEAYIYGAQGQISMAFDEHFTLRSGLTYTYGRIKTDTTDYPLDHIAPVYGRTGLEWRAKKVHAEFYVLYNGYKRLRDYNLAAGSEDNIQYATEYGTPAWYTLNVRASYAFTRNVSLQMGLENLQDTNYRTFASGVSAPGRNFQISLRASF
ncbi:MAG: TonB-dependent receptor [Flavobacteriales bacterium]|nr:TonB-dependent receptor [Flavobacteriales bacterium]MBL0036926.1 TonB-dependent receptor [Flavobacteriales bacterium]